MAYTYYLQLITDVPANVGTWPAAFTPVRDDDGPTTTAPEPTGHLVTVTVNSSIVTIFAAVQSRDVNNEPTMEIKPDSIHNLRLFRKRTGEVDVEITPSGGIIIPKKDSTLPVSDRLQVSIGNDIDVIADLNVNDQLYVTVTNNLAWNAVDQNFLRIFFMYAYLPR
jgi:hypothetical protein